jgi:hypothetical protein
MWTYFTVLFFCTKVHPWSVFSHKCVFCLEGLGYKYPSFGLFTRPERRSYEPVPVLDMDDKQKKNTVSMFVFSFLGMYW